MYQWLLTGGVLLICSITDLRYRRVYRAAIGGYLLMAFLGHILGHTLVFAELAAGLLPGAFCLLVSCLSRQSLGYGDSALAVVCGISLGIWPCMAVLFTAFFLSGLWAAGLLVLRRAERKRELPFVPFLFLGVLIQWIGGMQS